MCNCGLCCQTYACVRVRAQERAVLSVAGRSDGRGPQFCAVWWHCTSLIAPRLLKTRPSRSRSLIGVLCNRVIAIFSTISTYNAVSHPSPPLADGEAVGPQNMTIVPRRDGTASRSSTHLFLARAQKISLYSGANSRSQLYATDTFSGMPPRASTALMQHCIRIYWAPVLLR